MNRCKRKFLKRTVAFGVGPLLAACESIPLLPAATPENSDPTPVSIEDLYRSVAYSVGNAPTSARSVDQRAQSRIAKGIFDEIRLTGLIPKPLAMPSERLVQQAISAFHKARDRFANRRDLTSEEGLETAKHLLPLLRMYVDVHANQPSKGIQAFAKNGPTVAPDGTLTLHPGFRASSVQDGFCLDQELPAPTNGEILRLAPATDLIPVELQQLYRALQIKAYQDPEFRPYMQELVWTLRSVGNPKGLAANPSNRAINLLNLVLPNGADIVLQYHQLKVPPSPATSAGSLADALGFKNNWGNQDPEKILQGLVRAREGDAGCRELALPL